MSKDIETARLKSTIEMDTAKMKKGAETAKQISRSMASSINKNLDKVKNPLEGMAVGSNSLNSIKTFQKKLKQSIASATPKNMFDGFKNRVKQFQLDAGIKVHTDEFVDVENDISKAEKALEKLRLKEEDLREIGADQGMTEKYRKVKISADEAQKALDKLLKKQQELRKNSDDREYTDEYKRMLNEVQTKNAEIEALKAEIAERRIAGIPAIKLERGKPEINLDELLEKSSKELDELGRRRKADRSGQGQTWQV